MKKYYIKIQNKGEIDINGLSLLGVTDKRGDSDKIGFFGSGNKYAIALLLREKIPFKIFSGVKEIEIATEDVMFRGQIYEQIIIDGEKTSLTTSMGPDWESWFAIREIYCNAVDEGDCELTIADRIIPSMGKTTIYIESTEKIKSIFKNIQKYIIVNRLKINKVETKFGGVTFITPTADEFICYRKGIRIYPDNKEKSLYWYDFDKIEINESRTYKYDHQIKERMAGALASTTDKSIVKNYLKNYKDRYEKHALWEYTTRDNLSDAWQEILNGKRVYPEGIAEVSGDLEGKLGGYIVPDNLANKISVELKDVDVVGKNKSKNYIVIKEDAKENDTVKIAIEELQRLGFKITSKISIVKFSISDVIASYEKERDVILLGENHIGDDDLQNTILEEHYHSLGLADGNRTFVTYLIDEVLSLIKTGKLQ